MFSSVRKSVSIALTYQANQNRSQSSLRSILARDQVVGIWATFPIAPSILSAPVISHTRSIVLDNKNVICSYSQAHFKMYGL